MINASETPQVAARLLAAKAIAQGFKPEALHEYRSLNGALIYWRIRARLDDGEKWIRPMRVNGHGYELGEPDFPTGKKPLYNLDRIAADAAATVWIVEGEKAADALTKLGVIATTSGSAKSAHDADWSVLAARKCVIWPDNDDAGRGYAGDVGNILAALNCPLSCIDVDKLGLPPKGDAVEWMQSRQNAMLGDLETLPLLTYRPTTSSATAIDLASDVEWPAPQPLATKVASLPYPRDALPSAIQAAVAEVQAFTQAPFPLVASSAISALSLAAQAHVDIVRDERLSGPIGLYLLTVADSGERKTSCDGFFTKAIRDYERQQAEAAAPILKEYDADIVGWEAKRDAVKSLITRDRKKGLSTEKHEADLRALETGKPVAPRVPRLVYGDATPEALAFNLAKVWPSGGILSNEGGQVFGSHGMGRDSLMRNLAMLNVLWDGTPQTIDRRTSESFRVRGARLTVALQVQEPTLRAFFKHSDGLARGTGFLARFLVAWPDSTIGYRPYAEAPANWPALAPFHRRIADILAVPVTLDDGGALSPTPIPLSPDAKRAWVAFHDGIEEELRSGGDLYDVRDVASKAAENAARVAALFHVYEYGPTGSVAPEAVERAGRIVAWHLNESRRFFGELALPPELVDAGRLDDWLLRYCREHGLAGVRTQTIQQFGPVRRKDAIEAAVRELDDRDRARLIQERRRKEVRINPALLTGGAS